LKLHTTAVNDLKSIFQPYNILEEKTMIGAYYEGDKTFSIKDSKAVAPAAGEVRLDVAFCGVCGTDVHIYHGAMDQRVNIPQVIGHEMSGVVAELGEGVECFKVGDRVVVRPLDSRGETPEDKGVSHICKKLKFMGIDTPGAFQNSWTVPEFTLHKLPDHVDLKQAALVEPLSVACHDVRLGEVKSGDHVAVIGGGPIGLLVGLVAQAKGAKVILSEVNEFRLEKAKALGFETVNAMNEDVVEKVMAFTNQAGADVVFEVSGSAPGAAMMTELACIRGKIVVVAIYPEKQPLDLFKMFWKELKIMGARVYEAQDYDEAIDLIGKGELPLEKVVTNVQPLEELPQVFADLEGDTESLKVLVDCSSSNN
jgi:2-desacetyl-2-hydroxyethyl bacteriochlorophyllide A dehydrogenase